MNFGELKKTVLAFIRRTSASVTVDGQDILSQAINMARQYSERLYDFEHNRVLGKVTLTNAGAPISAITDENGTSLRVKSIKAAYLKDESTSKLFPIELISRAEHFVTARVVEVSRPTVVRFGDSLYFLPTPDQLKPVVVYLDVIRWLKDYTDDADTDFLLMYCADYMVFRTIEMLNFFLKEDARIPISQAMLDRAWKSVRVWDSNLVQGTITTSFLD